MTRIKFVHNKLLPFYFPIIVFIALITMTVLQISGSSLGYYDSFFNNSNTQSKINDYKAIRTDEWVVTTQLTIAQDKAGYPLVNENIGDGQNMSLVVDVPYKEWSTVFKPHNLAFLILPFNNAFAFKWWFLAAALAITVYAFGLQVLSKIKRKYILSSLLGIIAVASPFIFWWYQYITIGPLYYGFALLALFLYIMREKIVWKIITAGLLFLYTLVCFALVMYPPFQIIVAATVALFCLAYLVFTLKRHWHDKERKNIIKKIALIVSTGVLALVITGIFLVSRQTELGYVLNSSYPGKRISNAGELDPSFVFSNNLSGLVSDDEYATETDFIPHANQSEISNSSLPLLLITALTIYITIRLRSVTSQRKWIYILAGMLAIQVIILLKMFVPAFESVQGILFLQSVPSSRMLLGYSFVALICLTIIIKMLSEKKVRDKITHSYQPHIIAALTAIVYTAIAIVVSVKLPNALTQEVLPYALSGGIFFTLFVFLLLRNQTILSLAVLAAFSLTTVSGIMPLYTGKTVNITETRLAQSIQEISQSDPDGKWIVSDIPMLGLYPVANGAAAATGLYTYPQLNFWSKALELDDQTKHTLNRYARVNYIAEKNEPISVVNPKDPTGTVVIQDTVEIRGDVCDPFFKSIDVKYVITLNPPAINTDCAILVDSAAFPNFTTYIYRLS